MYITLLLKWLVYKTRDAFRIDLNLTVIRCVRLHSQESESRLLEIAWMFNPVEIPTFFAEEKIIMDFPKTVFPQTVLPCSLYYFLTAAITLLFLEMNE